MTSLPAVLHLGKRAARRDPRDLRLASYKTTSLPSPPATLTRSGRVPSWPMYLNGDIGDCAIADPAHQLELWSASVGVEISVTDHDVLVGYEAVSGYRPADPNHPTTNDTDVGCDMNTVRNYLRRTGLGGYRIAGYVAVNPASTLEVKQAIWLFGGVSLGLALPLSAQDQIQAGKRWTVGRGTRGQPGTWGGHAVPVLDYDASGLTCVTWGGLQRMTWGFLHRYAEEAFCELSTDWVDHVTQKSPTGVDYAALQADLAQFGA